MQGKLAKQGVVGCQTGGYGGAHHLAVLLNIFMASGTAIPLGPHLILYNGKVEGLSQIMSMVFLVLNLQFF